MEEPTKQPEAKPAPASITRRDFLRRAGKEAAETGVRLAPAGVVTRVVLGEPIVPGDQAGDAGRGGLLKSFLDWRRRRDTPAAAPVDEEKKA